MSHFRMLDRSVCPFCLAPNHHDHHHHLRRRWWRQRRSKKFNQVGESRKDHLPIRPIMSAAHKKRIRQLLCRVELQVLLVYLS